MISLMCIQMQARATRQLLLSLRRRETDHSCFRYAVTISSYTCTLVHGCTTILVLLLVLMLVL